MKKDLKIKTMQEIRDNIKGIFVLVHGAGVGGWVYRDVAILLRMYGYQVYTPSFTGCGERSHLLKKEQNINLEMHINDIVNCIEFNRLENVILVGHSYGGAIISGVVDRIPKAIKKQIYLDSFFLQNNQSIIEIFGKKREKDLKKIVEEEGEGWYLPKRFFGKEHPLILDMPWQPYIEKISLKGHGELISGAFIECTNPIHFEHLVEPKQKMKKLSLERGWKNYKLDSDHIPMTKSPEREMLVDILLKIAENK